LDNGRRQQPVFILRTQPLPRMEAAVLDELIAKWAAGSRPEVVRGE
jgi:hypothetical protein